jgi:hypothetical protein
MKTGQPTQTVIFGWLPDEPMVSRHLGATFENVLVKMPYVTIGACDHVSVMCDECIHEWQNDWHFLKQTICLN